MSKIRSLLSAIKKSFQIRHEATKTLSWLILDMYSLCVGYHVGTNTYVSEQLWNVQGEERNKWLEAYNLIYQQRCIQENEDKMYWANWKKWRKRYYQNRRFLVKYTSLKYDCSAKYQARRNEAYRKRYNMGENCWIQNGVTIIAEHGHEGNLTFGNSVILCRDADIDYTGDLFVGNNVCISEGAKIITHSHDVDKKSKNEHVHGKESAIISCLTIADNAWIGSRAIILPQCSYIGEGAVVGAGSVVTKDVPDFAIVVGNPAKVLRYRG